MNYILLSAAWLVIALLIGLAISFSGRIKKLPQLGLSFIVGSFTLGMVMLGYAIAEIL